MEKLEWSPQMLLGIASMDAEHHAFVDQIAQLAELPDEAFGPALYALIKTMERDFHGEETVMEEIGFPALLSHREQHARVLSALHHVVPGVMRGDFAAARKAIELLPQWFLFHLSTMDTALAAAIDIAGVVEPAE
ncbi:MAG: hemerythrin domain-containing protein [Burkholderiaceae bacterium]|nr:hemerythrin domain-containing protein [Burkholderiaceae bacterium]